MFRTRVRIENAMTRFFAQTDNNPSILDVLQNSDLASSLRNEVPCLMDFMCPDHSAKNVSYKNLKEFCRLAFGKSEKNSELGDSLPR